MIADTLIRDAETIRQALSDTARDLNLALERDAAARRVHAETKQSYGDAEAEIIFELVHSADGKNAEQRKAQVDIGLIRSRNDGALRSLWGRMVNAQYDAESAKVALEQMLRRYRAVEAAAELTTAMLHALGR